MNESQTVEVGKDRPLIKQSSPGEVAKMWDKAWGGIFGKPKVTMDNPHASVNWILSRLGVSHNWLTYPSPKDIQSSNAYLELTRGFSRKSPSEAAKRTKDYLTNIRNKEAEQLLAESLGIPLAQVILIRVAADSRDPKIVRQNVKDALIQPEKLLGENATPLLQFAKYMEQMTREDWEKTMMRIMNNKFELERSPGNMLPIHLSPEGIRQHTRGESVITEVGQRSYQKSLGIPDPLPNETLPEGIYTYTRYTGGAVRSAGNEILLNTARTPVLELFLTNEGQSLTIATLKASPSTQNG